MFPSPRGDKLQHERLFQCAGELAFPSPRGDKLQPETNAQWQALADVSVPSRG